MSDRHTAGAEVEAGDRSGKPVACLPSSTQCITIIGARGGHGASTVAAALALFAARHGPTTLVARDHWAAAVLMGLPSADADHIEVTSGLSLGRQLTDADATVVVDGGTGEPTAGGRWYVVLRGPCYIALASLLDRTGTAPDGLILVAEPGRSLSARDVTEVLGISVVATVRASPAVARTIDAGLLVSRVHRLRELAPLAALVAQRGPSGTHTDLPRPLGGRGVDRRVTTAGRSRSSR